MSAKALTYLVNSEFKEGIAGGVPSEIKVAHKFGERTLSADLKHLHDCGIVYYPDNPYILCVMTRGNNYQELSNIIKTISKMTYDEVESRKIE